ncbi:MULTISPECIES: hypothetical protein [Mycobacterium avium complex (MAC)]|jgi:hypothetical protein|uniref:Uncharacterized protein n=1 Tax=Mycobacterium avium subsp. hominissuis TaxID=439334 RepID=A0A187NDU3_MYCAV|nr:hypothetical protein [Mycobacterium avium]ETB37926.1 hypothetical protein O974_27880 [Mycobacterium avium 11-0986]AKT73059.1 hypothetical protein MASH_00072 [Mycobacterium avium subsp. hominissuis]MBZ4522137.1 hypothetical protein [Mycobacterium avium subsp. hominissuis]MBZ4526682.1 hypothetical protein [Mycobacterium avium subsp. hominissuis]MBZ4532394.1 hypothetical protein [Mycobacterium avium subsp. hominissuis]
MRTPHGRLSAQDVAVLEALVPVGILVAPDESMKLVPVLGGGVVAAHVGASADSLTADHGLVFWFDPATHSLPINRMATFNLHAVSAFSLRTVPLLRGTVLITGMRAGLPAGLTGEQIKALRNEPEPAWLAGWLMRIRVARDNRRR